MGKEEKEIFKQFVKLFEEQKQLAIKTQQGYLDRAVNMLVDECASMLCLEEQQAAL